MGSCTHLNLLTFRLLSVFICHWSYISLLSLTCSFLLSQGCLLEGLTFRIFTFYYTPWIRVLSFHCHMCSFNFFNIILIHLIRRFHIDYRIVVLANSPRSITNFDLSNVYVLLCLLPSKSHEVLEWIFQKWPFFKLFFELCL